ncbi:hypothetical protein I204_03087 [Kwoniella mangroviensis CBS 8886]|nr:hypothetical protein I204_03087 [Kwoniella mangroviensis CBS 8886]
MFNYPTFFIGITTLGSMGLVRAEGENETTSTNQSQSQPDLVGALSNTVVNALISDQCRNALKDTFSPQSELGQCQFYEDLIGVTDDASLDSYLTTACGADPCSDETLSKAANAFWTGCETELGYVGITKDMLLEAFGAYTISREIACLKTNNDYCLTNSIGNILGTQSSSQGNSSESAPQTGKYEEMIRWYFCDECSIASIDLVLVQYPILAQIDLDGGKTVVDYVNGYCSNKGISTSTDGTLPQGITKTAHNSTFPSTNGLVKRMFTRNIGVLKSRFMGML